jgi:hypothetical protein
VKYNGTERFLLGEIALSYTKFYFRPGAGDNIYTTVHLFPDERSAINGRVLDTKDRPIQDALVLLLDESHTLLSAVSSDEAGCFAFGPLKPDTLYCIKVYKNDIRLRELEIRPD